MIVGFNNALQKSKVSHSIGRIGFVNNRIIMRNPTSSAKSPQKKNPLNRSDREDLRMKVKTHFDTRCTRHCPFIKRFTFL